MLNKESFEAEYYEKKPCVMRGSISPDAVGWPDVDEALYLGEQGTNGIMLHHKGSFVKDELYTETCIDVERRRRRIKKKEFSEIVADGGSIIFNRMESVSYPVRKICQEFSRYTGADTVANGYISFGGHQAFGNHWDTHDVFAVQLMGRKKWTIFPPTFNLPLPDQRSGPFKDDCPRVPCLEVILEAGDVLYVPRGWWHNAEALLDEQTFHIAVGVHPVLVLDYVKWLAAETFKNGEIFREVLKLDQSGADQMTRLAHQVAEEFVNPIALARFAAAQRQGERWFSKYDLAFSFLNTEQSIEDSRMFVIHWSLSNLRLLERAAEIGGDDHQAALSIVKLVGTSSHGMSFGSLAVQLLPLARKKVERIVRILVRDDLLSLTT